MFMFSLLEFPTKMSILNPHSSQGQDKAAKDIEKVLMDIQVNMTNIKPDPWGQAKDKLYKCPHCETAFARRQYLR